MRPSLFVVLVGTSTLALACGSADRPDERPEVVSAIYPLAFITQRVGGDQIDVQDLTPTGAEPHDVELTPQQVVTLSGADLIVLIGGGFQPSIEEALGSADGAILDARDAVAEELLEGDPHLWLDPILLAKVADSVAEALSELVPEDAEDFRDRAAELRRELEAVDALYRETLDDCERSEMVTAHDAFGYLAARYDLEQIPIAGIDPAAEPSAGRIAEIAELARERSVTTIFTESLVSPRVAETVAAEAGVATAVLDPIESEPEDADLISAMEGNLEVLAKALGCTL